MASEPKKSYLLGDYRLETDKQLLSREGKRVHLPKRPFHVLLYLIEHRNEVVSRNELLDRFWDGKDVYDDALRKCVGTARKALGDNSDRPRFIETRYAGGYRYIGPVEEQSDSFTVEVERTRGVRIVVEEEEIHDSAPTNASTQVVQARPSNLVMNAPKSHRRMMTTLLILLVTVITASALVAYRASGRNSVTAGANSNAPPIKSLAVLPLKNLSRDSSSEYFTDGMTDSLITALAKIDNLKVVSRGSVFNFKDEEADPREIGKQLGVAAVLEGTVEKTDKNVRVAVRLVSTDDGAVLWVSDNYDRPTGDVFVIQDEIARGVTSGLRLKLSAQSEQRVTQHYTNNRDAYESYLKGRYFWNERTIPNALSKAISAFNDAAEKDPKYALAYSGLADSYIMSFWYAPMSSNEALIKARQFATTALQLDNTLAEAHTSMAAVAENEWNWKAAQTEFQRAIELNPNYATAHHWYALYLLGVDRPEQAIEEIRRARESDPLSLPINSDVGYVFFCARRYDEAITEYKKALMLNADFPMALEGLALSYVKSGHPKEAIALATRLPNPDRSCNIGYIYGAAGERADANRILSEIIRRSEREYVSPACIAEVYAGLDDKDKSLSWLEKAYREHSPDFPTIALPFYDGLRTYPGFVDLTHKVGL